MIPVELSSQVVASLRQMRDRGEQPARCHDGVIRSAIAGAVRRLVEGGLSDGVRPWDLLELQRRAAGLGDVSAATAVRVDADVLLAELAPGGERIVLRGVDDAWRLVRFTDGDDASLRPETTRSVSLHGSGPDAVLAALGIAKPDGIELEYSSEDLGQGETEYRHGYRWTDDVGRSVVAEEIKNEIFDGATPYSTYLRGVVIDGDRGVLLTGRDGSALIIEG
ncbi:hypothetical protein H7J93_12105 [Mycobacterium barrassiae]|uniref:hypothetical protein n=1 Tax=Mycobacterium barrassiae TaxID=319709 RepID=UPI0022659E29|nr:hypothetical protein [Mycobacterium barrassiae]MCV7300373.1 hypothetical protein [Mycobacterium barrassiae]